MKHVIGRVQDWPILIQSTIVHDVYILVRYTCHLCSLLPIPYPALDVRALSLATTRRRTDRTSDSTVTSRMAKPSGLLSIPTAELATYSFLTFIESMSCLIVNSNPSKVIGSGEDGCL